MKNKHPLSLIALTILLLITNVAGSTRAARPELEILPTWEFYGYYQGDRLGIAVAGAGLVNGDSYADILVGADKGGTNREGQALLFLGGASGPQGTPAWNVLGEKKGSLFGAAVDGAGDVDNDGYDDIVVGAANYSGTAPSDEAGEGAVYVYYGSAAGPGLTADWKVEGDLAGIQLGAAVAGGGYINGDDYADVIVGMPGFDYGGLTNAGGAYVFFGSETGLEANPGWYDYGLQSGAQFGLEVNAAGDVNGDGYDDVLVGEPNYDNDIYLDAGAVYLYLGTQFSLASVPSWSMVGYRGGDQLGKSVSSAGDVNGDGCDDIAVGAPYYNLPGMLDTGRVYLFFGCQATASGLNPTPDWEYSYPQANMNLGIDVSSAGDTNDDGYDELLVGADLFDDEQANEGAVFAFFGTASGIAIQPIWRVEGNKNDTFFGIAVDGAGDTDGDGYADVLIGAPEYRYVEDNLGAAFVFFGTPETTSSFYLNFLPFLIRR
jgi:hypothetical protein